jgi:acetyl-CoA C-acetyltransferase
MNTYIVGLDHTPFQRWQDEDVESLMARVISGALADANVTAEEIDEVFVGHFNEGFSRQGFTASLVMQQQPGLRFKPVSRLENACATGSAAFHAGVQAIESGRGKQVLVVGVEKMTDAENPGAILARASYVKEEERFGSFADLFAQITNSYFAAYGDQSEAMAMIAAKNHQNGLDNPNAQLRKDLDFQFCSTVSDKNPLISGFLRRTDCSPISDGAAAVVLADEDIAKAMARKVRVRAITQVNDYLPMSRRDMSKLEGCAKAWSQIFERTGLTLDDLDLMETHDCFTIAELMQYEAMGLTAYGDGARAIKEGWTSREGRLPVNRSGGLKAKGHPIGATGVSMHVMAARQLLDNYVSILERVND